jgi:hypothetical protein
MYHSPILIVTVFVTVQFSSASPFEESSTNRRARCPCDVLPPLRVVWRAHDLPMGLCGGVMKTGRGWRFYLARYIRTDITWFNKPAGVRKRVRLAAKPRQSDKPEALLTERLIEESLAESVGGRAMNIGLVAASLEQAEGPQEAKRLYTSPLFHLSADYCRRHYHRWFILSWEHRLIHPEMVLLRSEEVQACGSPADQRRWAEDVLACLRTLGLAEEKFFIHAGANQAALLLPVLDAAWPVRGLSQDEQLARYKFHLRDLLVP